MPDEVGNLYKTESRKDRKYGKGGQLQQDQDWNYRYDEEGNLTQKSNNNISWQYNWNANGMLKNVKKPNGAVIEFEYDALGRRTAKICNNTITRFLWDGNLLLHEWSYDVAERPQQIVNEFGEILLDREESTPNVVTWVYEEGSFVPSAKIVNDSKYSIISDYIGRPVQAFSETGDVVWETDYDIYGGLRKLVGDKAFIPFRQLGQYEDLETGLYYNRFRYYSSDTGTYLSKDPISLTGNNPNLYAYVHNSNAQVDLFGLNECKYGPNDGGKLEDDIEQALKNSGIDFTRGRKVGTKGEIDFETSSHIIEATVSNGGKLKQIKKYKTPEFNPEGKQIVLVGPNYTNRAAVRDIQNEGSQVVHTIEDLITLIK